MTADLTIDLDRAIALNKVKEHVRAAVEIEQQKQGLAEALKGVFDAAENDGVNLKALKQVVKNACKEKDDFCPYVDALSEYTHILFK